MTGADALSRCSWVGNDPEYMRYHDEEWGYPLHGDQNLFEKISLEAFQSGLSWITILKRRPAFREVFHGFEIERVANLTPAEVDALMSDDRIIRNRAKIQATVANAQAARELTSGNPGALDALIWSFARPSASRPTRDADTPVFTPESIALSSELRRLGFRFVGPTTVYALMQSAGIVDDHASLCWRATE